MANSRHTFEELKRIIARLRDPEDGCPWDREQTHETLKTYLLEEVYEVLDAIDQKPEELCDELGDLLLQILLHSQIASEDSRFTIDDVIHGLAFKMIHRHPHVFGQEELGTAGEVITRWEEIKQREKKGRSSVLDGIPAGMPALLQADKIGRRVSRVGFDWSQPTEVLKKVAEELHELEAALRSSNTSEVEEEVGDFLFSTVQLARLLGFQAELLLRSANKKFEKRFRELESRTGGDLGDMTLEQMHTIWDQIKSREKTADEQSS